MLGAAAGLVAAGTAVTVGGKAVAVGSSSGWVGTGVWLGVAIVAVASNGAPEAAPVVAVTSNVGGLLPGAVEQAASRAAIATNQRMFLEVFPNCDGIVLP
jgi:hypothetical protein